MGMVKRRIYPCDIVINIGEGAPVPAHPYPNQGWKDIRHDRTGASSAAVDRSRHAQARERQCKLLEGLPNRVSQCQNEQHRARQGLDAGA